MNSDIIIVDDNERVLESLTMYARHKGLAPQSFTLPALAEEYLEQRQEPPLGYFVDMRIPHDLDGSERLFNRVRGRKDPLERFYFMTGSISEHDLEVQARTGARILEKGTDQIHSMLEELCRLYRA